MSELTDRIAALEIRLEEAEAAQAGLGAEIGDQGASWAMIIREMKSRGGYQRAFNAVADLIGAHPRPGCAVEDERAAIEVCNTIEARIRRATGTTYLHQSILSLSLRLLDTGSCITSQETEMIIALGKRLEEEE